MGASAVVYFSGTATTASTTWAAMVSGGSWDVTIPAAAGDVVELGISTLWAPASCYTYLDAATMVSGSPVNWVSTGNGSHVNGVLAWFQENTNAYIPAGGSGFYTVQSGDIVSGNVTFRVYGKTNTSTRDFSLSSPAVFWASVCDNTPNTSSLTGTLSSSSYTALTGSATVSAAAGDVIACSISGLLDNSSTGLAAFDAATIVSSTATNWFSSGTSTKANGGVDAWRCNLGNYEPITGTALYTVQSGDVVSGQVTVKIYGLLVSGSRVLDSSSNFTLRKV